MTFQSPLWLLLLLAVAGVLFTALCIAGAAKFMVPDLPWAAAVALGAIVALVEAGVSLAAAVAGVAACPGVPGRLERVDAGQDFTVLVDYSHKPGAVEAETANDLVIDGTERVRERRGAKARREFGGRRRAADRLMPLDDDDRSLAFGERGGGDQAVQAGADDGDVVGHRRPPWSTRIAALRPGAAMMPPPGCVADPQRNRRLIGVR